MTFESRVCGVALILLSLPVGCTSGVSYKIQEDFDLPKKMASCLQRYSNSPILQKGIVTLGRGDVHTWYTDIPKGTSMMFLHPELHFKIVIFRRTDAARIQTLIDRPLIARSRDSENLDVIVRGRIYEGDALSCWGLPNSESSLVIVEKLDIIGIQKRVRNNN